MLNRIYVVGLAYIGVAALAISRSGREIEPVTPPEREIITHAEAEPVPVVPQSGGDAAGWFQRIKPFCNTVEVVTALQQNPPPAYSGSAGPGYQAACLALAGQIEQAREIIGALPAEQQWEAAGIVFTVAHPVADAGDDRSAGPIMAMVVEFWPNHYMALYHAGMSEVALGETTKAREHLEAFLRHYNAEDGWRSSAKGALERLGR
ncbi:MAG: tetratricopeptide repeat protein [Gemmatimonadales bacterium]